MSGPVPVQHLSIYGQPALTPDTAPSSSVMVCRHLFLLFGVGGLSPVLTGVCLISSICGSGFINLGGLEALNEISNRSIDALGLRIPGTKDLQCSFRCVFPAPFCSPASSLGVRTG